MLRWWYLVGDIWVVMFGWWCLVDDVWMVMFGLWYLDDDVWMVNALAFERQAETCAKLCQSSPLMSRYLSLSLPRCPHQGWQRLGLGWAFLLQSPPPGFGWGLISSFFWSPVCDRSPVGPWVVLGCSSECAAVLPILSRLAKASLERFLHLLGSRVCSNYREGKLSRL